MKDYQKRAIDNYRSKYDFVTVRLPKGDAEKLQVAAERARLSRNDYIVKALRKEARIEVF